MKKLAFISILLVLLPLSHATGECVYNLLGQGWGFNDGEAVGNAWGVVGLLAEVQPENPPIEFDYDTYEVSFAVLDMVIDSVTGDDVKVFELGSGTVGIYEDTGFDFDPGTDPSMGIDTATNGNLALGGEVLHATLIINYIYEIGTLLGEIDWTSGSYLADVEALGDLNWSMNFGLSFGDEVPVPDGYHSLWVGKFLSACVTSTQESTWGEIKGIY